MGQAEAGSPASPSRAGGDSPHAKRYTTIDIPKEPTGIQGLDWVLQGGFPRGRVTLVCGGPGSGKTVLGMEFIYRGAEQGMPGMFVSFEEEAVSLRRNALSLGWDLQRLEKQNLLGLLDPMPRPGSVPAGEFSLHGLAAILAGKAEELGVCRIAIDAIDVLLRLFKDPIQEREELHFLHAWLLKKGMTAVLTVKRDGANGTDQYGFLDYMADCVLMLDQRITTQISTRRVRVLKYRGSGFGRNEYPFIIEDGGINLLPVSEAELSYQPMGPTVPSGLPGLDSILNGGYRRNSTLLISGAPGIGKTTIASCFVREACSRGERVLYINLEESEESMVQCMLSPGVDLRPALEQGALVIRTLMPESMGAEEHLIRILRELDSFGASHLVIDAVSACKRMGSKQSTFEFLLRIIYGCKDRGVTCLFTNQETLPAQSMEFDEFGILSMIDTVLVLRYEERDGSLQRSILAVKSRGNRHSTRRHHFTIGDQGIEIHDAGPFDPNRPGGSGLGESHAR